jgi:hypothetical protein
MLRPTLGEDRGKIPREHGNAEKIESKNFGENVICFRMKPLQPPSPSPINQFGTLLAVI